MPKIDLDVVVEDHGSIILVRPLTDAAREWLDENTNGSWWAGALACEPRYIMDLLGGMADAGFEV